MTLVDDRDPPSRIVTVHFPDGTTGPAIKLSEDVIVAGGAALQARVQPSDVITIDGVRREITRVHVKMRLAHERGQTESEGHSVTVEIAHREGWAPRPAASPWPPPPPMLRNQYAVECIARDGTPSMWLYTIKVLNDDANRTWQVRA